ncbi:hypothetical protein TPB0596_28200 [Tsukamurella pulmonis]|uniref:hypothetical protein n=1 Tax=Tsukamurella pulmonis TaxID=47312 RepID=UPI001EDD1870|nr:hypothetical protein [Tsukamurella pulmonis]BDD83057.1 hypothetical protein TPB0596_28200 [Tsukamurella pulmonis]
MRARHLVAGTTVAVLAAVGLPGVAQAAPVVPAQAVLAAHEFPAGSTGYTQKSSIESAASVPSAKTPCTTATYEAEKATAGGRSTTATARRGSTVLDASVIDRVVIDKAIEIGRACTDDGPMPGTRLSAPADLARYRTVFSSNAGGRELIGFIGVRDSTVRVDAVSVRDRADFDAFWQTVRAQVAKVERQP